MSNEEIDEIKNRVDLKITLSGSHASTLRTIKEKLGANSYPEAVRVLLTKITEGTFIILPKTDVNLLNFLIQIEQERAIPKFYDIESILTEALQSWKNTYLSALNLGNLQIRSALNEHELAVAKVLWEVIFDTEKFYMGVPMEYLKSQTQLPESTLRVILKKFVRTRLIKIINHEGKTYYFPRR